MKVCCVGAGASGLMVSGFLSQNAEVTIFDKNEKAGKKLFITGKGRCNLTNLCSNEEFLANCVRGEKFLRGAISDFSAYDTVEFFENLGLKTKVERGNRVFPESDKSSDVINALLKHCKDVDFHLNEKVISISKGNTCFEVKTDKGKYIFDRVIIATGGKSYQSTGSSGDGYAFAKNFGHSIVEIRPALCPIELSDDCKILQGVSLKNVMLKCKIDGKKVDFFGEMLFTNKGISGPIVLSASSFLNRAKIIELSIDFKPALDGEKLEKRILRDFDENKNKDLKFVLKGLIPNSLTEVFAKVAKLDIHTKVHEITKEQRKTICDCLKNFPLHFKRLYDVDAGIITSGGVNLSEVDPKTMESKLTKGLYFLGEVLDVDALTGGFNLQIAWSTAFKCYKNFFKG